MAGESGSLSAAGEPQDQASHLTRLAHDLKGPMNSVLGYAELLGRGIYGPLSAKQQRASDGIHTQGRKVLDGIDDLVAWFRIQAGDRPKDQRPFDALVVAAEVVAELQPRFSEAGINLVPPTNGDGAVAPTALGEWGFVASALTKLLENALAAGRAAVRVDVGELGDQVRIDVIDDGPGLPPAVRATLDRPLGPERPADAPGLGLGIVLARGWLEGMGGGLRYETPANGGTVARISLPAARSDEPLGGSHA